MLGASQGTCNNLTFGYGGTDAQGKITKGEPFASDFLSNYKCLHPNSQVSATTKPSQAARVQDPTGSAKTAFTPAALIRA